MIIGIGIKLVLDESNYYSGFMKIASRLFNYALRSRSYE